MKYTIRHVTRYDYSDAIRESVMEVRKQPHSDDQQHCYRFSLELEPSATVSTFEDYQGNTIHLFDVPRSHRRLVITAEALVEVNAPVALPDALPESAWEDLDVAISDDSFWDMLTPSHYIHPSMRLEMLAEELDIMARRDDPLSLLRELTSSLYGAFEYASTTSADSPMDDALGTRSGVCQDFAHIMIALCRFYLHIPCRYISGYLYTGQDDHDRSAEDASHAWVEAWLPEYGWIGFDPTNNLLVADRHIRVAVGRDYADVPPTHGVFRGEADSELSVGVQVKIADNLPFDDDFFAELQKNSFATEAHMQQQQQQQQ